ncbi:MAG TPA: MFS transporter, partial [Paraburkholderia sp.]|nr:MFS transporter [Paraburkholderia sp.]
GRAGAIVAPILIGVLVGMGLPLQQNFMAIGLPALVAAASVALINHRRSASHLAEPVTSAATQQVVRG